MNIATLKDVALDIISIVDDYAGGPKREMLIDPALYVRLRATGRNVERQYHAHLPGSQRPPRIDFRVKPPNAVLIEFAVRPPSGGGQLYGSQNRSELHKLCRFDNSRAKLRALLLIDLSKTAIPVEALRPTYRAVNSGRGNFKRSPVQVIYAHRSGAYSFRWNPIATGKDAC
jgi:hypothetical protein